MKRYCALINSPIGKLGITTLGEYLTHIDFLPDTAINIKPNNHLAKEVVQQLQTYFSNPQHIFSLPLHLEQGTPFQQRVWNALKDIPTAYRANYGTLAKQLSTSARAIGNACRHNPIPIVVPCHRVVANHHIGGYAGKLQGKMITIKTWLLEHECSRNEYYG